MDASRELQDLLLRIPEPNNIACQGFIELFGRKGATKRWRLIDSNDVRTVLVNAVDRRQGRFEEFLSNRRDAELKVLVALAKAQAPITEPQGRAFVAATGLSLPEA